MVPLPEYLAVFDDLVWGLSLDLFGNVVDLIPAVLLVQTDELIEVALRPVGETLLQEFLLFLLLILRQLLSIVNLPLLFALDFFRVGAKVSVDGHLVTHGLAVVVDFLIQKLKQPGRKELEVLDNW